MLTEFPADYRNVFIGAIFIVLSYFIFGNRNSAQKKMDYTDFNKTFISPLKEFLYNQHSTANY